MDNVTSTLMKNGLDGVWYRQQAISDNIANVETPDYKRKWVEYEDDLRKILEDNDTKRGAIAEMNQTDAMLYVKSNEINRNDGNSINIDFENIELARAQLQYSVLTQQMTNSFSRLRTAITGASQ